MATNGEKTTNLTRQFAIDEVLGNTTIEGVMNTVRVPFSALADQLAGTGTFVLGNVVFAATEALLDASTPPSATAGGAVLADPDATRNGYYTQDGAGGWDWQRGFPDTLASVTLSGTGTAQTGVVEAGVNPADVVEFRATVATENTGPLTLSIGGEEPRPVVNLAGNALSAGEWTGVVKFFIDSNGDYRLSHDAGAAAAAAQSATDAATEKGYAEEWAQSDNPISVAAGGDGSTDRSAKYWAGQSVGITWAGPYDAGTEYSLNDGVLDNGSSWRYINETAGTGNAPPALPITSNAHWQLVASAGVDGAPGGGLKGIGCTVVDIAGGDPATDYESGDTVNGVVLAENNVILRATAAGDAADGVYVVPASGAASRHPDFDTWDEIYGGLFPIADGSMWQNTNGAGGILGTTALTFSDVSMDGSFSDATFRVEDDSDSTKKIAFQVSEIATGTTRTVTMGDADVTLRPRAWEMIARASETSLASLDFTDLSAYRQLRLSAKLFSVNDAVNVQALTSTDNGVTFDAASSDYAEQASTVKGTTFTGAALSGASGTAFFLTYGTLLGNALNEAMSFVLDIFDFNENALCFFQSRAFWVDNSGAVNIANNAGVRSEAVARDALRIVLSSGNIARIDYVLEGLR